MGLQIECPRFDQIQTAEWDDGAIYSVTVKSKLLSVFNTVNLPDTLRTLQI
jgi:hypothetical protein